MNINRRSSWNQLGWKVALGLPSTTSKVFSAAADAADAAAAAAAAAADDAEEGSVESEDDEEGDADAEEEEEDDEEDDGPTMQSRLSARLCMSSSHTSTILPNTSDRRGQPKS